MFGARRPTSTSSVREEGDEERDDVLRLRAVEDEDADDGEGDDDEEEEGCVGRYFFDSAGRRGRNGMWPNGASI